MRFVFFTVVVLFFLNMLVFADKPIFIMPGIGIGDFVVGVPLDEMRKKLEHPDLLLMENTESIQAVKVYKYKPFDITITVNGIKDKIVEEIYTQSSNVRTYSGSGIGSSMVQIIKEYGEDYTKINGRLIYFGKGIAFSFDKTKLVAMTVFSVGNQVLTFYRQGMAELEIGDFVKAEQSFQKVLSLEEKNIEAQVGLGIAYMNQDKPFLAVRSFEKALSLDSKYAPAYHSLASAYTKYGRPEEAVKAYKHAAEMIPNDPEIHTSLANLYIDLSKVDMAIDEFKKALKIEPQNYTALMGLGMAYEFRGDKSLAAKTYRKILEVIPQLDQERAVDLEMRIKFLEQ